MLLNTEDQINEKKDSKAEDYSKIFALFASLFEHPDAETLALVKKIQSDLSEKVSFEILEKWLLESSPANIGESFVNTFDLKMVSYPYAGYHLFGESFKRGEFLSKLLDRYRKFSFPHESLVFKDLDTGELTEAIKAESFQIKELPDHLKVILCFVAYLFSTLAPKEEGAKDQSETESEELIEPSRDEVIPEIMTLIDDCLIPVVNDMLFDFGKREFRDPMKSSAFFEKSNCAESLETLLADKSDCGSCDTEQPLGSFSYEETETEKKSDKERYKNKDNPYAIILESLLSFLEEASGFIKGEEPCST